MTEAGSASGAGWGGRPVAYRIADARNRMRLVVAGTITATQVVSLGQSYAYRCELEDGTGQVVLIFVGRSEVPGLAKGARCAAEGTVRDDRSELVILNPLYRLES